MLLKRFAADWLLQSGILSPIDTHSTTATLSMLSMPATDACVSGSMISNMLSVAGINTAIAPPIVASAGTKESPAARLYNWNSLLPGLASIGVQIDADTKSLIVAGDEDVIQQIVEETVKAIMQSRAGGNNNNNNNVNNNGGSRENSSAVVKKGSKGGKRAGGSSERRSSLTKNNNNNARQIDDGVESNFGNNNNNNNNLKNRSSQGRLSREDSFPPQQRAGSFAIQQPLPLGVQSCFEYITLSMVQFLGLDSSVAATLVGTDRARLAIVIQQGPQEAGFLEAQGSGHQPVVRWLQHLFAEIPTLVRLIASEPPSAMPTLRVFECGLNSPSLDVVSWSCKVLARLGYDLKNTNFRNSHSNKNNSNLNQVISDLSTRAWEWFALPSIFGRGLDSILLCYNLHGSSAVKQMLFSVISQFAAGKLSEFFCRLIPDALSTVQDGAIRWLVENLPLVAEDVNLKQEFLNASVFTELRAMCNRGLQSSDSASQHASSVLAVTLCVSFPECDEVAPLVDAVRKAITTLANSDSHPQQHNYNINSNKGGINNYNSNNNNITSSPVSKDLVNLLGSLFAILEQAIAKRHKFAPVIFKSAIRAVVDVYHHVSVRNFAFANLNKLLVNWPRIPVTALVDALMRQVVVRGVSNLDFDLFTTLSQHPRLEPSSAVSLAVAMAHLCGPTHGTKPLFSRLSGSVLLSVLSRFSEEVGAVEAVVALTRSTMRQANRLGLKNGISGSDNNPSGGEENEGESEAGMRTGLALEVLERIAHLQIVNVNKTLYPIVFTTLQELEEQNAGSTVLLHRLRALVSLLSKENGPQLSLVSPNKKMLGRNGQSEPTRWSEEFDSILARATLQSTMHTTSNNDNFQRTAFEAIHDGSSVLLSSQDEASPLPRDIDGEHSDFSKLPYRRRRQLRQASHDTDNSDSESPLYPHPPRQQDKRSNNNNSNNNNAPIPQQGNSPSIQIKGIHNRPTNSNNNNNNNNRGSREESREFSISPHRVSTKPNPNLRMDKASPSVRGSSNNNNNFHDDNNNNNSFNAPGSNSKVNVSTHTPRSVASDDDDTRSVNRTRILQQRRKREQEIERIGQRRKERMEQQKRDFEEKMQRDERIKRMLRKRAEMEAETRREQQPSRTRSALGVASSPVAERDESTGRSGLRASRQSLHSAHGSPVRAPRFWEDMSRYSVMWQNDDHHRRMRVMHVLELLWGCFEVATRDPAKRRAFSPTVSGRRRLNSASSHLETDRMSVNAVSARGQHSNSRATSAGRSSRIGIVLSMEEIEYQKKLAKRQERLRAKIQAHEKEKVEREKQQKEEEEKVQALLQQSKKAAEEKERARRQRMKDKLAQYHKDKDLLREKEKTEEQEKLALAEQERKKRLREWLKNKRHSGANGLDDPDSRISALVRNAGYESEGRENAKEDVVEEKSGGAESAKKPVNKKAESKEAKGEEEAAVVVEEKPKKEEKVQPQETAKKSSDEKKKPAPSPQQPQTEVAEVKEIAPPSNNNDNPPPPPADVKEEAGREEQIIAPGGETETWTIKSENNNNKEGEEAPPAPPAPPAAAEETKTEAS